MLYFDPLRIREEIIQKRKKETTIFHEHKLCIMPLCIYVLLLHSGGILSKPYLKITHYPFFAIRRQKKISFFDCTSSVRVLIDFEFIDFASRLLWLRKIKILFYFFRNILRVLQWLW